jgi:hypothetical protein
MTIDLACVTNPRIVLAGEAETKAVAWHRGISKTKGGNG